jgi:hypothetical protein
MALLTYLTANLTVQGQHVNSASIQVYIHICILCCTVSLGLNMKHILNDINQCYDSVLDS